MTLRYLLLPALLLPIASHATIYKCTLSDGQILFQQKCPDNAVSAQKQAISEVSNVGFSKDNNQRLTPGSDIISNGDFEQKTQGWEVVLGTANTITREGVSGSTALQLTSDGEVQEKHIIRQCLPINGIAKANISAFIKKEGGDKHTNELRVVSFTSDDCTTGGQYAAQIPPTAAPGWQKISQQGLEPILGAKSIMVEIAHLNDAKSGPSSALWDDIEFTVVDIAKTLDGAGPYSAHTKPVGVNYLVNPSLDNDLSGWNQIWPGEWEEYGGKGVTGGILVKASSDFGQTIQGEALTQCINIGTHKQFEASAAFKKDKLSSQNGFGELRIIWHQNLDCHGLQKLAGKVKSQEGEQWQVLKTTATNAFNAQSATITLTQTIEGAGLYGAFWDDIVFKAVE